MWQVRVRHRLVIVCFKKPNYPLSRVTYTSHSLFDNISFMCSLKERSGMDWALQERKDEKEVSERRCPDCEETFYFPQGPGLRGSSFRHLPTKHPRRKPCDPHNNTAAPGYPLTGNLRSLPPFSRECRHTTAASHAPPHPTKEGTDYHNNLFKHTAVPVLHFYPKLDNQNFCCLRRSNQGLL